MFEYVCLTISRTRIALQYIPRNMHTVFALHCFVVVIHWLIFPYPSGLLHWHCGNLTIAPVPAKQPWWIWIKTSCEFIMNDCITTTKQSTTKPCAYFLGYTVASGIWSLHTHMGYLFCMQITILAQVIWWAHHTSCCVCVWYDTAVDKKCTSHFAEFMQERHNSIANELELRISCTDPSIWSCIQHL